MYFDLYYRIRGYLLTNLTYSFNIINISNNYLVNNNKR